MALDCARVDPRPGCDGCDVLAPVRRRRAFQGPHRVLARAWPAIYASQALLAALVGIRLSRHVAAWPAIVAIVISAWLGELVALTLFGSLLANEIDPEVAYVFWWMGTAGPLQPAAVVLAGAIGLGLRGRGAG